MPNRQWTNLGVVHANVGDWRGGKRSASKKKTLKSSPNSMELTLKYFGRKSKNTPMMTVATIGDNDALSPLTPPLSNIHEKSFEESTLD